VNLKSGAGRGLIFQTVKLHFKSGAGRGLIFQTVKPHFKSGAAVINFVIYLKLELNFLLNLESLVMPRTWL
jgi:hypothetical protein